MKKKRIMYALSVTIACVLFYVYIDGFIPYKIQKTIMPTLKLIEYYTGKRFPNETSIESFKFHDDWTEAHEGAFEAVLNIPMNSIDDLFSEEERYYGSVYPIKVSGLESSKIDFEVSQYCAVRRLTYISSRHMHFTILNPEEDTIKIYVLIDRLGWYETNKWKL